MTDCDLFVIGAGSAGVRAARLAAAAGKRVIIAEAREPGGTCVLRGCVPKKLLVYAGDGLQSAREAGAYGVRGLQPDLDWPTLREGVRAETLRLSGLYAGLLERSGVRLLHGRARLTGPHEVSVGEQMFTAEHLLIAVGGEPIRPRPFGMTSDDVFALPELPAQCTVYGGGYIGMEMAHILHTLGVRVRLAFRGPAPLRGFDADVVRVLEAAYRDDGIALQPHTPLESLTQADNVLWAVGRRPLTDDLGLQALGIATDPAGHVQVDVCLRTSVPSVFAAGDAVGRLPLTPVALHEAGCIVETLYGAGEKIPDYTDVPGAVFSRPEAAGVGVTEAAADFPHAVYLTEFRPMRHALSGRSGTMLMKVIVDRRDDALRGIHIVGEGAAEMVQCLAVAVKARLTKAQLSAVMPLHPTAAEELITLRTPVRLGDGA